MQFKIDIANGKNTLSCAAQQQTPFFEDKEKTRRVGTVEIINEP